MLLVLRPVRPVLAVALAAALLAPGRSHAQTYTWSVTTGGSWTSSPNWGSPPNLYPHNLNDTAIFSSTGNSTPKTVTLDAAIGIRAVQFAAGQTGTVIITPGSGGSLTLTNSNGAPTSVTVDAASGDHAITANLTLAGPTDHTWNIGAGRTFTVGSVAQAGTGATLGITKTGTGILLLNGNAGSIGTVNVTAGTLGGSGTAPAVSVAAGAFVTAGTSAAAPTLTVAGGLTLSGGYQVHLFSTAAGAASRLAVTGGTVNLSSTTDSLRLVLDPGVTVAALRAAGPKSYTVVTTSPGALVGTFNATDFTTAGFQASEWAVVYNDSTGNVTLNFTPVPESTWAVGAAAGGLLAGWGRRRWRRVARV